MSSATSMSFYDFEPKDGKGEPYPINELKGKVVLIVNVASKCGFTPQYKGLEKLYKEVSEQYPGKFTILGFPCNQFGSQEPGSNEEIASFCQLNYGVSFPVLAKVNVNGDNAEPIYTWLKHHLPGLLGMKRIKWNFEKFLVSADGKPVQRWSSVAKPESIRDTIIQEIKKIPADGEQKAESPKPAGTAAEPAAEPTTAPSRDSSL
ncbi:peroxiredoxin hyr1 [Ascosphaera atra]|nr:peroxiredoxin hyr1 [Ascosphaera atra]